MVDLNVLKKFQRQGIDSKLMGEAEKRIKKYRRMPELDLELLENMG